MDKIHQVCSECKLFTNEDSFGDGWCYKRLETIASKYGFKSVYEIVQSLIHCFLRASDPENDPQTEVLPYDIECMFNELSEAEKHVEFNKPKRRCSCKSVSNE